MADPFIGEVKMFGLNFAPVGWAQCDGQILQIAQHTALFSLLGTTYGGDGQNTLALPDLRGRFPLHPGAGPGLSSRSRGERAGEESVQLSTSTMPAHTHAHSHKVSSASADSRSPKGNAPATLSDDPPYASSGNTSTTLTSSSVGGGASHDNMPPFLAINFCIALVGTFPTEF